YGRKYGGSIRGPIRSARGFSWHFATKIHRAQIEFRGAPGNSCGLWPRRRRTSTYLSRRSHVPITGELQESITEYGSKYGRPPLGDFRSSPPEFRGHFATKIRRAPKSHFVA